MHSVRINAALGALALLANSARAKEVIISLVPMTIDDDAHFIGKKDKKDKVAEDISGMGCMAAQGDTRACLVINDENKRAQFVTIRNDRITIGNSIPLIGDKPVPGTLGSQPE